VYIDGFCGPGRYDAGEPGSPLIAIELATTARHSSAILDLVFVDEDKSRIAHLKEELKAIKRPERVRVHVKNARFDSYLRQLLGNRGSQGFPPTLVFADPFGFRGIPYNLFEDLLRYPHTELFVTLSTTAINRFNKHPDPRVREHIHEVFGLDMTDQAPSLGLYERRLKELAKFVRLFELKNSRNNTTLHLAFASKHRLGHIKMKEAMWRVDPDGEFRFWDFTDAEQPGLFHPDHSADVAHVILDYLQEKEDVKVKEVVEYIEDETHYLQRHAKDALKKLEHDGLIQVGPYKEDGSPRRVRTFPDDAIINLQTIEAGEADG
jgi:three-Cys-motif partner protein